MTVAQQPEGIGQRACGEKVLSFKDLQLYQQNQNETKEKKGGKGKGGSTQRNLGKRKAEDTSKLPCHNWSRGNGFCKDADACRYSHDGPKGGGTTSTTKAVTHKRIKTEKNKKSPP